MDKKSIQVIITGLVQGVGFRPFVYRIASKYNLSGWVQNTNENVRLEVSGNQKDISGFLNSLSREAPPAAIIENISVSETEAKSFPDFSIYSSNDVSYEITEISPDIGVCVDCLHDIDQPGSRENYAFVNCTNCGPRFTIIRDLPYDRAKTTMNSFPMCGDCKLEYENILDRRFHAQPAACSHCGPKYQLFVKGKIVSENINFIINYTTECIEKGGIVLIKGLGGMHLACDAFNGEAVKKLRNLKNREGKPFAVMFRDFESLQGFVEIDETEKQSLLSWRRPIVLLRKKKFSKTAVLSENLNASLTLLGVMLPYLPFHFLLFRYLKSPAIVLTSGNFSSEPILTDNITAIEQFSQHVDAMVLHNRDIYNRTDDSVVRIEVRKERVFRRSRGWVPAPVRTSLNTDGIVAFGAELTNTFCVGKGSKAFLSQHIGDLQGIETTEFYESTLTRFLKLFRIRPSLHAVDLHPDYISTKTGLKSNGLPVVRVQHHHAHIASCMAENHLDEKVIGVAFDGTGYGSDGHTWGSEFLVCDFNDFKRCTHFEYIPIPGGDTASEEPWRMAISYLYKVYGNSFRNLELPFLEETDPGKVDFLIQMIEKGINCPLTSGAGRLFDAVSALLNLVKVATFQAEGPMRLESIIKPGFQESYCFDHGNTISFDKTIRGIVEDLTNDTDNSIISAKFHNTIILSIFDSVNKLRMNEGINKVVLSGGVFQNKYLLEGVTEIVKKNNFEVYSHALVPCNDGGIALGQLAIASKRRELQCV